MITAKDIATLLDGELVGDGSVQISGVAKVEEAQPGMLAFIAHPKYEKYAEITGASCILVNRSFDPTKFTKVPPSLVKLDDPYSSFVIAIEKFAPKKIDFPKGIDSSAAVHSSVKVGKNCSIGAYAVIAENAVIGDNSVIHPHVVVGRDVKIGNDCVLYPSVTIREECILGNRVIIQPGAVIGGDGFGFAPKKDGTYRKIPQLGIVVIEDDVEIQANTCVDRATLGETRIKRGTKLDNMVQIAHNVVIGEDTVIAGSSGVAGSTKVGNRNMIGGAVAITGHIFTVDDVKVAGGSIVSRSLDEPGETYSGYPAKKAAKWRKIEAASRSLPEMITEMRELKEKLHALEEEIAALKNSSASR
jgi:UDP-3-O-[3-hydroxymyristoyl] glucosamine N-acyltransferase